MHIGIISFSILTVHALTAGFFTYLQKIKRQPYLHVWTIGWYLLVLRDVIILGAPWWGTSSWSMLIGKSLFAASAVAFFCAARIYVNSRPWTPAAFMLGSWLALCALSLRFESLWMAPQIGLMALYLSVAFVFWQEARRQESYGDWVLAAAFAGWAIMPILRMDFGPLST